MSFYCSELYMIILNEICTTNFESQLSSQNVFLDLTKNYIFTSNLFVVFLYKIYDFVSS